MKRHRVDAAVNREFSYALTRPRSSATLSRRERGEGGRASPALQTLSGWTAAC
jgi:hypothetical protein